MGCGKEIGAQAGAFRASWAFLVENSQVLPKRLPLAAFAFVGPPCLRDREDGRDQDQRPRKNRPRGRVSTVPGFTMA